MAARRTISHSERRGRLSDRELDARLHDAAVELVAAELPSLARAVREARRRLGLDRGGAR
jgi:hypothetical protein